MELMTWCWARWEAGLLTRDEAREFLVEFWERTGGLVVMEGDVQAERRMEEMRMTGIEFLHIGAPD